MASIVQVRPNVTSFLRLQCVTVTKGGFGMNEYKKLAYQLEDTFALGISLPVVAIRQLPKIAERFAALPNDPDYLDGVQYVMHKNIMSFVEKNKRYMDDERELRTVFEKAHKSKMYSHHYFKIYEMMKSLSP